MKRILLLVVAVLAWTCVVAYGATVGWWLSPIAQRGDPRAFMDAAIALGNTRSKGNIALVLMRDGEVYAQHFAPSVDPVNGDTRFPLASMSKWFTAYDVMQLVQEGKVSLDAPISTYLTQWQLPGDSTQLKQVTARRLLSHTAGLTDGLGFADYLPTETIPSTSESLRHPRASSDSAVAIVVGREPGKEFQYSGGGYLTLQAMIEDVTGTPFAVWMQNKIFDPIGMRGATYAYLGDLENASRSFDPTGTLAPSYKYAAAGATGLSASANDLIAFAQAQIHKRIFPGDSLLLRRAGVDNMRQPHARKAGIDIWGLGVALYAPTASGDYVFGHDGSNTPAINTTVRINPDNGDAVIVLVNGNSSLATAIGSEWTLWQTGIPDFLMVDRIVRSALLPWLTGIVALLIAWVLLRMRSRRKRSQVPA